MGRFERRGAAIVPGLDGRRTVASGFDRPDSIIDRIAAYGPVALVVAGMAATAAWAGILAWWAFALVRWALG